MSAALGWIDSLVVDGHGPVVLSQVRQSELQAETDMLRDAVSVWWTSTNPRVRLAAALLATEFFAQKDEAVARRDLGDFFCTLLTDATDPHAQRLAALGLAMMHLQWGTESRDARDREIVYLCDVLKVRHARGAALAALDALAQWHLPWSWPRLPGSFVPDFSVLFCESETPVSDSWRALSLEIEFGDFDYSARRDLLRRWLRDTSASGDALAFLVPLVSSCQEEDLIEVVTNAELPVDHRGRVIAALRDRSQSPATWDLWKPLADQAEVPALSEAVIQLFANRLRGYHWPDLMQYAQCRALTFETRCRLYQRLWEDVGEIEQGNPLAEPVLTTLLTLGSDPSVPSAVFGSEPIRPFAGQIPPEALESLLRLLRAHRDEASLRHLSMLACAIPAEAPLSEADRSLLIDRQLLALGTVSPSYADRVRDAIAQNARLLPQYARKIALDASFPAVQRIQLFHKLTYQDFLTIARDTPIDHPQREMLIRQVVLGLHRYVPQDLWSELNRDAMHDGLILREILATPGFYTADASGLIAVTIDTTRSKFCRRFADECILAAAQDSEAARKRLLRECIGFLTSQDLNQAGEFTLSRYFVQLAWPETLIAELSDDLITAIEDEHVPEKRKVALLRCMKNAVIHGRPGRLWRSLAKISHPADRAAALDMLIDHSLLSPELRQLSRLLGNARQSGRQEEAERLWNDLRQLDEILDADALALVDRLISVEDPAILRQQALWKIRQVPFDSPESQRLWNYVVSERGARIWQHPDLQHVAVTIIERVVGQGTAAQGICDVLSKGPEHPIWPALVGLAQLPDRALAKAALRKRESYVAAAQWESWRATHVPQVPDNALIAVESLIASRLVTPNASAPGYALINHAFTSCRASNSTTAELVETLVRAATRPQFTRTLIGKLLNRCRIEESDPSPATTLIALLRYFQMSASLLSHETGAGRGLFDDEPDVRDNGKVLLADIPEAGSAGEMLRIVQGRVVQKFCQIFTGLTPSEAESLLQQTIAPAILAWHYRNVHPQGLPLLVESAIAASRGPSVWEEWRFLREEARAQISYLSEDQVAQWRRNLRTDVAATHITEDVRGAAEKIRARMGRALRDGEVPAEYRVLVQPQRGREVEAAQQIETFRRLLAVLGQAIRGDRPSLPRDVCDALPEEFARDVEDLLHSGHESSQDLLALRQRTERAIDLLRLLNCDAHALAHNRLRATGEPATEEASARSAVGYLNNLRYAFRKPGTRRERAQASADRMTIDAALAEAQDALSQITSFGTRASLIASECDDFKTMIEIGHRPYGQGSCQNYASSSPINSRLLAYVVDAMTKAIVIRTAPTPGNPQGTIVARAIIRVGKSSDGKTPAVVLEPTYAASPDLETYDPLIRQAALEFARQRGWRVAVAEKGNGQSGTAGFVWIPQSQNGEQYEDAAYAITKGSPDTDYTLRIAYLDDSPGQ